MGRLKILGVSTQGTPEGVEVKSAILATINYSQETPAP